MTKAVIFLGERGSGKTALINSLVACGTFRKPPVVIVCESGRRSVDWDLISEGKVSLWPVVPTQGKGTGRNPAVSLRKSLVTIMQTSSPEYVLIESWTSANVDDVSRVVEEVGKECPIEVDAAIAMVDATALLEIPTSTSKLVRELADVPMVVLTNTSELTDFSLYRARSVLHAFSNCPVLQLNKQSDVGRILALAEVSWSMRRKPRE